MVAIDINDGYALGMLPSSTDLEYFLEVANTLNLSRASERLGIGQPSLSLAIKRLEQVVGAELFFRHKQGVNLTQAGKQLLQQTKELLRAWQQTKARALASHQAVQGAFTIGCHPTIGLHILTRFFADLCEKYPDLDLRLQHDHSRKINEEVISFNIDIGIVANPIRHPDLIIRTLCKDEVCFWVGKGTRKIQDPASEQAVILCDPDLQQTQTLLKKAKKAGLVSQRIITSVSLEAIAALTNSGAGIGILPTRVAKALFPSGLTRISHLPTYADQLDMVYRNENRHIYAMQVMTKIIKDAFK